MRGAVSLPSRFLALDPSITRVGLAYFEDGELVAAKAIKVDKRMGDDIAARALYAARLSAGWGRSQVDGILNVVCEWPKVYTRDKSKGDPASVIPLAGVCVGTAAMLHGNVTSYLPGEWAGRTPKHETVKGAKTSPRAMRVKSRLQGGELLVWQAVKYHDTVDAIGIGLHHLGRFKRRRVFGGVS